MSSRTRARAAVQEHRTRIIAAVILVVGAAPHRLRCACSSFQQRALTPAPWIGCINQDRARHPRRRRTNLETAALTDPWRSCDRTWREPTGIAYR